MFIPCSRAGEADGGVGARVGLPTTEVSRQNGLVVDCDRVCGCCGTGRGSWSVPAGPAGSAVVAGDDDVNGDAGVGGWRTGFGGQPARIARAEVHRRCAGGGAMRQWAAVAVVVVAAVAVADSVGGATVVTVAVAAWGTSGLGTRRRPMENHRQCRKNRSAVAASSKEVAA